MNAFFTSAAAKQVDKAQARVVLGVQLIAPSLRPGMRKGGEIIDGFFTMWAQVHQGDETPACSIEDGAKVRLKLWADSLKVQVPADAEGIESFEDALRAKLFYAELSGTVEPLEYVQTDKRDGSQSNHKQIKVTTLKLMAKLPGFHQVEEETTTEEQF